MGSGGRCIVWCLEEFSWVRQWRKSRGSSVFCFASREGFAFGG
jgi:hypothetical protein